MVDCPKITQGNFTTPDYDKTAIEVGTSSARVVIHDNDCDGLFNYEHSSRDWFHDVNYKTGNLQYVLWDQKDVPIPAIRNYIKTLSDSDQALQADRNLAEHDPARARQLLVNSLRASNDLGAIRETPNFDMVRDLVRGSSNWLRNFGASLRDNKPWKNFVARAATILPASSQIALSPEQQTHLDAAFSHLDSKINSVGEKTLDYLTGIFVGPFIGLGGLAMGFGMLVGGIFSAPFRSR